MPALVAGIHVFLAVRSKQSVDGRDKPGHDSQKMINREAAKSSPARPEPS